MKNPVVSVFTHENGTVSVGISGQSGTYYTKKTAKALENELNKGTPGKYKVSHSIDKELREKMEKSGKGEPGNKIGACAEPKAVSATNKNQSPITRMDTRWRHPEEVKLNPHKYSGIDKTSDSQMDPCKTCEAYGQEYMEHANKNKK